VRREAGLTLFFSPPSGAGGHETALADVGAADFGRPTAAAIAECAAASGATVAFSISHQPPQHPYWLELLALGLTFDLRGLAPGMAAQVSAPGHAFGLPRDEASRLEAVVLRPGPHLAAAGALLPIVRTMAALGCELAGLPGLRGIGWEPAGTIMAPDYYRRTIASWLEGGAFPALGLAALSRMPDGGMRIIGLDPGLQHTGWGIIDQDGSRLSFVALITAWSSGDTVIRVTRKSRGPNGAPAFQRVRIYASIFIILISAIFTPSPASVVAK